MGVELISAISAGAAALLTALLLGIKDIIKAKKEKTGDRELEYSHSENLVSLMSNSTQEILELKTLVQNQTKEMTESFEKSIQDLSDNIDGVNEKLEDLIAEQKEFNIAMLRHDITSTYYEYKDKEIPDPIYMSTLDLYDKYTMLGGNSWVSNLVEDFKYRKTGK